MAAPVVHWEFWSQEPQKISDFYARVFGWQIRPIPGMDYNLVETGGTGGINGGIMKPQPGPVPAKLTVYIDVDEIEPYLEKVVAAGGRVLAPVQEVPGVGWLALFMDPDERVVGIWKQLAAGR